MYRELIYSGRELIYGRPGDAGIDLLCEESWIEPRGWTNVDCHNAVQIPPGYWGLLMGRSSTFFQKHLMVNQAVIDNGYRGPLFVCVYNPGDESYHVSEGERLAQLILMPLAPRFPLCRVDCVDETTKRGTAGFGSTG